MKKLILMAVAAIWAGAAIHFSHKTSQKMGSVNLQLTGHVFDEGWYEAGSGQLELKFRGGGAYRYFEVPRSVAEGLRHADKQGRFFNHHIRGQYAFEKYQPKNNNQRGSIWQP